MNVCVNKTAVNRAVARNNALSDAFIRIKAEKFDKLAATLSDLLRLQGKTEQVSVPVMPDRSALKNEMESALAGLREDLKKLREAAGIL